MSLQVFIADNHKCHLFCIVTTFYFVYLFWGGGGEGVRFRKPKFVLPGTVTVTPEFYLNLIGPYVTIIQP